MTADKIKQLLKQYKLAPLKSRGQHFLIQEAALEKIIQVAKVGRYDTILEIGPGLGVLTKSLAARARQVIAVEIDKGFVTLLANELRNFPNVFIDHADILTYDLSGVIETRYKIIGSLPYAIVPDIIEKFLLANESRPELMVVMVQKEQALRMSAKPPRMNRLALLVQYYGTVTIAASLPPHAFWPQPKVCSSLVRISVAPRDQLMLTREQEQTMMEVARQAFSQPRKKVKNTLTPHNCPFALQEKRPGDITLRDWIALVRSMPP